MVQPFRAAARAVMCLPAILTLSQTPPPVLSGAFSGPYHCGGIAGVFELSFRPAADPLGFPDPDAGVVAGFNVRFRRSLTETDLAGYRLTGQYDPKTGRFHLI